MDIIQVKIIDLIPATYNARMMTEQQAKDLEQSIKKFGLVDPIIVNSNPERLNVVIGGHQRLKIAQQLGFAEVPVYYVDLDEQQEQELNLRLNKNTGSWDWDMLINFDESMLEAVGFDRKEFEQFTPEVLDKVELPTGEKGKLQQITFTVDGDQAACIKQAIGYVLKNYPDLATLDNKNKNGNAIAHICEVFTNELGLKDNGQSEGNFNQTDRQQIG